MSRHYCVTFPLLLVAFGVAFSSAFAQDAPVGASDSIRVVIPQYVLTSLATGAFGWLLRSGGIPLRVTVALEERDRDIIRDVRDLLREAVQHRSE